MVKWLFCGKIISHLKAIERKILLKFTSKERTNILCTSRVIVLLAVMALWCNWEVLFWRYFALLKPSIRILFYFLIFILFYFYIILFCIILFCTNLFCIILFYSILPYLMVFYDLYFDALIRCVFLKLFYILFPAPLPLILTDFDSNRFFY